ncbi:hypothetical protein NQ318_018323 [Aromia moschata]|uniref:Integrase zinc-binding domain-containing protein n=1 Tax=Aromia moschata TaxID=1265417 RepID=A0AAV8ZDM0_9CUCU|nr:hypothetical protein NQ318_018323 [Aromia moschata]
MVKKALEKPARFANWRLQNGRLFKFVEATYPGLQDPQDLWREVVPKERRKELIREYHEPPTMGHMGVTKTYARLMELPDRADGDTENHREQGFNKLFEDVRKRLDLATKKHEKTYNLRRRAEEFFPQQAVWRRNFVLSDASKYFSKKLAPRYIGPFYVKKKLSPWTYELEDTDGRSAGVWNAKDLKSAASAVENLQG